MRNARLLLLAVVAAVSAVGCDAAGITGSSHEDALTVQPSIATLNGGQAIRLVASLHLANGSRMTPDNVTWSSADASIATVDPSGSVHALRAGRVQIVATWHTSRGSSLILVADQVTKKQPGGCLALKAAESSIPTNRPCR
jgi:uncharacterized protein YjdB